MRDVMCAIRYTPYEEFTCLSYYGIYQLWKMDKEQPSNTPDAVNSQNWQRKEIISVKRSTLKKIIIHQPAVTSYQARKLRAQTSSDTNSTGIYNARSKKLSLSMALICDCILIVNCISADGSIKLRHWLTSVLNIASTLILFMQHTYTDIIF